MNKSKAKVVTTDGHLNGALTRARRFVGSDRRVVDARYERALDLITLFLDDGIRVSIPRTKLEGLQDAAPEKVAEIKILGRGTGLHWPLLNVDHYVPGLLNRVFGTSRWMTELGRRGGLASTKAKAAAARANGKKGGRPKHRAARYYSRITQDCCPRNPTQANPACVGRPPVAVVTALLHLNLALPFLPMLAALL
jgi:hypothetical protein